MAISRRSKLASANTSEDSEDKSNSWECENNSCKTQSSSGASHTISIEVPSFLARSAIVIIKSTIGTSIEASVTCINFWVISPSSKETNYIASSGWAKSGRASRIGSVNTLEFINVGNTSWITIAGSATREALNACSLAISWCIWICKSAISTCWVSGLE